MERRPEVVLLNPPSTESHQANRDFMGGFGTLNARHVTRVPPVTLEYVAGALSHAGMEVQSHDLALESPSVADRILQDVQGRAVGLLTSTGTYWRDLALADQLKERLGSFTFLFGQQVSAFPELTVMKSSIDAAIVGEPESTAVELVRAVLSGSTWKNIPGLCWKENGRVQTSKPRAPTTDVDRIPFPLRKPEDYRRYFYKKNEQPFISVLASRGCPLDCIYCPYPVTQGSDWRGRSAANIIEELVEARRSISFEMVLFRDPIFTLNRKRVHDLCEWIRGAKLSFRWRCETTTATVDEGLLGAMREAGCVGICFGVETGNPDMHKRYSKKTGGLERVRRIFKACREVGIETTAFFILGLPEETKQTIEDSYNLAVEIEPTELIINTATPYPHTGIYRLMVEKYPQFREDFDHFRNYNPSYSLCGIPPDDLQKILRRLYVRFYGRPKRLLLELRKDPLLFATKAFSMFRALGVSE